MTEEQLSATFGEKGYKCLPDKVYHRYKFTPAKVEVEEHHAAVYAGKADDDTLVRADHPGCLLQGSLVSPSMEAAIINAKYVNACPLYRQEKEFERYGIKISRQNMACWTIQCAGRFLAVLYDYLHGKIYGYHVLQADEMHVLENKDGRTARAKSYMWVYGRSSCMNNRRHAMSVIPGSSLKASAAYASRTGIRSTTRLKTNGKTCFHGRQISRNTAVSLKRMAIKVYSNHPDSACPLLFLTIFV